MTEAQIRETVRTLVLDAAPIKNGPAQGTLSGDLGYDSLGREELVALLEDEFPELRVPDTAFEVETVADVEALVLELLGSELPG
jgi:acyl carrier protein